MGKKGKKSKAEAAAPAPAPAPEAAPEPSPLDKMLAIRRSVLQNEQRNCTREGRVEEVRKAFALRRATAEKTDAGDEYLKLLDEYCDEAVALVEAQYTCEYLANEKEVLTADLHKAVSSQEALKKLSTNVLEQKKLLQKELELAKGTMEAKVKEAMLHEREAIMPTIEKVQAALNDQEEERKKVVQENIDLREKVKNMMELFDKVQKDFDSKDEIMKLQVLQEKQYETRMNEQELKLKELTLMLKEKLETEIALRQQLGQYEEELPKLNQMINKTAEKYKKDLKKHAGTAKEASEQALAARKKLAIAESDLVRAKTELADAVDLVSKISNQRDALQRLCNNLVAEKKARASGAEKENVAA